MGGLGVGLRGRRLDRGRRRGGGLGVGIGFLVGFLAGLLRRGRGRGWRGGRSLLGRRLGCRGIRRGRRRFARRGGGGSGGVAKASSCFASGSVAGACATAAGCSGAGCSGSAAPVSGAVAAVLATALGGATCPRDRVAAAPLLRERRRRQPGRRKTNAEQIRRRGRCGGGGLPAASCSGAAPVARRLKGSWLTRKVANMAKPQLSATTEATTAAIKRRTSGNIRPRITAARDLGRSTRHWRMPIIARQMAPRRRQPTARRPTGATLTESAKIQCKKSKKNRPARRWPDIQMFASA